VEQAQRPDHLVTHAPPRVERRKRVLEHHLNSPALLQAAVGGAAGQGGIVEAQGP
jgi:hypothetical protein